MNATVKGCFSRWQTLRERFVKEKWIVELDGMHQGQRHRLVQNGPYCKYSKTCFCAVLFHTILFLCDWFCAILFLCDFFLVIYFYAVYES